MGSCCQIVFGCVSQESFKVSVVARCLLCALHLPREGCGLLCARYRRSEGVDFALIRLTPLVMPLSSLQMDSSPLRLVSRSNIFDFLAPIPNPDSVTFIASLTHRNDLEIFHHLIPLICPPRPPCRCCSSDSYSSYPSPPPSSPLPRSPPSALPPFRLLLRRRRQQVRISL